MLPATLEQSGSPQVVDALLALVSAGHEPICFQIFQHACGQSVSNRGVDIAPGALATCLTKCQKDQDAAAPAD